MEKKEIIIMKKNKKKEDKYEHLYLCMKYYNCKKCPRYKKCYEKEVKKYKKSKVGEIYG